MIISNTELDDGLVHVLSFMRTFWLTQYYCLTDLYNTGCRYNELYQAWRISEFDINTYKIITEKGSNPRYIPKATFTDFFNNNLTPTTTSFNYCKFSTTERLIRSYFTYRNVKVGNKGCSSHLFRYNFIRGLYDGGMSYEDIAILIGEVDVKNIKGYVNNPINGDI